MCCKRVAIRFDTRMGYGSVYPTDVNVIRGSRQKTIVGLESWGFHEYSFLEGSFRWEQKTALVVNFSITRSFLGCLGLVQGLNHMIKTQACSVFPRPIFRMWLLSSRFHVTCFISGNRIYSTLRRKVEGLKTIMSLSFFFLKCYFIINYIIHTKESK